MSNSERPNIVFLHVDQLHHQALSCMGNEHVHTPHMDRIFSEGHAFTFSHCSNPVCCPSRASWYTGRMSSETGLIDNGYSCDPDLPDLGQWMGARGYDCFYAGKWHVTGRDLDGSFQVLTHGNPHGERGDPAVAKVAEAFLHNHDRGAKPFFLNVGFLNPHDCCYMGFPADRGRNFKQNLRVPLKAELPPNPPNYNPTQKPPSPNIRDWNSDDFALYSYCYYRMVEMVDAEVGRVYRALEDSGHTDDTLFIFASDHGEMKGAHNRILKGLLFDDALRIPLVCRLPGSGKANARDNIHATTNVDVTATILDYAGLPMLPGMHVARSLRPLLEGRPTQWREYVVAETLHGGAQRCVRTARHKTIFNFKRQSIQLYDMLEDPWEKHDLSEDSRFRSVIDQHRVFLADYTRRIEPSEAYRTANPDPDYFFQSENVL